MLAPPPDVSQGFEWGPVLTAVGIAVSLGWNLLNTFLAGSIKRADRRLDEFKRLRTRLDAATGVLREVSGSLRALGISSSPKAKWLKQVTEQNQAMGEAYRKAQLVLEDLDRSLYVRQSNWLAATGNHWDNALDSINGAYNPTRSVTEQKQSVANCAAHLEAMVGAIESEIENEMKLYASVANKG